MPEKEALTALRKKEDSKREVFMAYIVQLEIELVLMGLSELMLQPQNTRRLYMFSRHINGVTENASKLREYYG